MKATDFNRHQTPPGGWQWRQPQTGWAAPNPVSCTFNQQVENIIKHRLANPAITAKHKLLTDAEGVGIELENFNRKRLGVQEGVQPVPFPHHPGVGLPGVAGVGRAVAAVRKLASGAALLLEWEQSKLPPESQEVAEARATVCAACPLNDKGTSLSEFFTVPAADMIRRHLQRLNELKLMTSRDAELNICAACLCPLRLKTFCPKELILKRLKPKVKAELHPDCWIHKLE